MEAIGAQFHSEVVGPVAFAVVSMVYLALWVAEGQFMSSSSLGCLLMFSHVVHLKGFCSLPVFSDFYSALLSQILQSNSLFLASSFCNHDVHWIWAEYIGTCWCLSLLKKRIAQNMCLLADSSRVVFRRAGYSETPQNMASIIPPDQGAPLWHRRLWHTEGVPPWLSTDNLTIILVQKSKTPKSGELKLL